MASSYSRKTAGVNALNTKLRKGVINMGGDVIRLSTRVTPYEHGDLRVRRRVVPTSKGARIEWNSGHAAVQNRGSNNGRPFRHYTTPGTGAHFVEAGLKAVSENIRGYF